MSLFNRMVAIGRSTGNFNIRIMEESDFNLYFSEAPSLDTVLRIGHFASKEVGLMRPKVDFSSTKKELELFWFYLDLLDLSGYMYVLRNTDLYDEVNDVFRNSLASV